MKIEQYLCPLGQTVASMTYQLFIVRNICHFYMRYRKNITFKQRNYNMDHIVYRFLARRHRLVISQLV